MAKISEAFAIAIQHHQSGRLQEAEQIYRQIVAVEPNHAGAIHLLGVVAFQAGKFDEAVARYRQVLELQPKYAEARLQPGQCTEGPGKTGGSDSLLPPGPGVKPDFPCADNNLGVAFKELGKLDEAVACYRRVLERRPNYAEAHNNLGVALKEQGRVEEAVACYRRALALESNYAEAQNNLGNALRDQGKLPEAVACYRRAWP